MLPDFNQTMTDLVTKNIENHPPSTTPNQEKVPPTAHAAPQAQAPAHRQPAPMLPAGHDSGNHPHNAISLDPDGLWMSGRGKRA